jgi:prephenate dehydrogenase
MKLAVIGVGLIGGSFALGLKKAKAVSHVVGVGRNQAAAAREADVVLVAAPVGQYEAIFSSLQKSRALITDAGSTKRDVVAAARKGLGKTVARFVPGHPIAGAEKSGAAAASAELFRNRRVVLTPLAENEEDSIAKVQALWSACGAKVSRMGAEEHDAVLAAVSHLPHLLAFALVHEVAERENSAELFSFAAGGFRDFTRIASSHPEMWRDICVANRDRLLDEVSRFSKKLDHVKALLDNPEKLEKLFAEARAARDAWIHSS